MKKCICLSIVTIIILLFSTVLCSAESTTQALSADEVLNIINSNDSMGLNPPYDYDRDSKEYIEPIQRSLTLRETILYLPGKNGLDVNLNCTYNSHDSSVSLTKMDSYYEKEFCYYTYCYSYTEEDGDIKNIYILFDTEDIMLEKAPLSFTAEALPTAKTDDYGDKYYKYNTFDLADEGLTFTRRVDLKPYPIEFSKSTMLNESDINTFRLKVGDLWRWELPAVFSKIKPSKTDWDDDSNYYNLYTAFSDMDNEYWSVHFAYDEDKDSDEITYTDIKPQNIDFLTWYDSVSGDIYDEEKGISYCCRIQDTKGRTMYFNYNGFISAVEDRFGNMIKYTFEDSLLTKIEDTLGRIVSLTYDDGHILIYVDYDGNGPEDAKLHTKMLYSSENNNELDPNNYLIADDSYVSEIVRFEDDNTEYTCTYNYKKGYAYSYISGTSSKNIQTPRSIVTKTTHPNNLITEYSYVRLGKGGYISRNDYRIASRKDIDNGTEKNNMTYSPAISVVGTVETRTLDGRKTTYRGNDVITSKSVVYDDVEFSESYEYTAVKKKKRTSITQKYKKGSSSSAERVILTPITSYLPKGTSYDDYSQTITYYDGSSFIETEIYNQSEDVFVKKTYTMSEEGDDFYHGRTIDLMTVSESTDGGDTYVDKYSVAYTYNPDGTLLSETLDPNGINQVTTYNYTYSADGSITTTSTISNLKDADGNSLDDISTSSKVDSLGRLIWTKDGNGNETTYKYDGIGRLVKVTNPDDTTIEYEYDILNRTTTVTDENGIMHKIKYDGLGNILASYKNAGTASTPRWVAVTEYEYDALCRPVSVIEYTAFDETTPEKWIETHYTYGAFDKVLENAVYDETETELSKKTYTYNFLDRIKASSNALNPHEKANGGLARKFTSVLIESAAKDGITPPTVKQYLDRQGRLCEQITTDGDNAYILTYTYDAVGNVLEHKDEAAYAEYDVDYSQKYEYNYLNKVVKAYNAEGNYIENTYDVLGRQLSSTDYMGNTTTYTYDSIGRLLTESAPVDTNQSSLVKYYYDANSNTICTTKSTASGNVSYNNTYDNRNRLISSFDGATYTVNEYDGNLLVKTASGLPSVMDISSLSPYNSTYTVSAFTYDKFGNLVYDISFNGTTSYTYDLAGNVTASTDPNTNTTFNEYDSRGNLVSSTIEGDTISYAYNSFDLVTASTRNGVSTTYAYDNFGRNTLETTGSNTITRTYNTNGQVESMTLKKGEEILQTAEYEYNVLGNMTSASDGTNIVTYTYNENGLPIEEEKPGIITTYEYTPGNLMKNATHTRRRVNDPTYEEGYNDLRFVSSFEYSYYPDGNVSAVTDTRFNKIYNTIYQYDNANRLTSANIAQNDESVRTWAYTYNNRGDRTSQTVTDETGTIATTNYTYTNHRLAQETTNGSTTTYTYDANGNTLSKTGADKTYVYTYTPRNEVSSVTTGGVTHSYTYNASSLRTSKTSNEITTAFVWAGDNIIREETSDKTTDYFYGVNRVSRTVKGDAYTYNAVTDSYYDETTDEYIETIVPVNSYHEFYAYDGRGNVVHTMALDSIDLYLSPFYASNAPFPEMDLNGNGKFDFEDLNYASSYYPIVRDYYYSPFGEIWKGEIDCDTNPFRYAGEYLDKETGDIYLRARYYSPSTGRFLSIDPIKDGTNWYVYCSNNPIAFVDPSGLLPTDEEAAKMSALVYSEEIPEGISSRTVSGWLLSAPITGRESLVGGVFTKVHDDGSVEYSVVFRGSILLFDDENINETVTVWKNNLEQAFSSNSTDAWDAIVFGVDFVEDHPNSEITFVGHSKGGAEAILAAVVTNKNAITFNSAKPNLDNYGLSTSTYTGNITSYVARGEILSVIKQSNRLGTVRYIDVLSPVSYSNNIIEEHMNNLKIAIDKHSLNHMINYFEGRKQ